MSDRRVAAVVLGAWPALALAALASATPARAADVPAAGPAAAPGGDARLLSEATGLIERTERLLRSYAVKSDLEFFDGDKRTKAMTLWLAIDPTSTVALFRKPAYDEGKAVLFGKDGYFLYFPGPDRYIRVSPQNAIYGNIAFGDIVKPPLLSYYEAVSARARGDLVEVVFETRPGSSLIYFRKIVRIDLRRKAIREIESYSRSGVLLGKTVNLEFRSVQGVMFPSLSRIVDTKDPKSYAIQRNSDVRAIDLPPTFFAPSALRDVSGFLEGRLGL